MIICGDPGIGKSILIKSVMHEIKQNGLTGFNEEFKINFSTINDGLRLNIVNLDLISIGQG
jgi:DNA replication protein DnaC